MIDKDVWVLIKKELLQPDERASTLPEATRRVPLCLWLKGTLLHPASLHETVQIRTVTGRRVEGVLIEANPSYRHDFGRDCPELRTVRTIVYEALQTAENDR